MTRGLNRSFTLLFVELLFEFSPDLRRWRGRLQTASHRRKPLESRQLSGAIVAAFQMLGHGSPLVGRKLFVEVG